MNESPKKRTCCVAGTPGGEACPEVARRPPLQLVYRNQRGSGGKDRVNVPSRGLQPRSWSQLYSACAPPKAGSNPHQWGYPPTQSTPSAPARDTTTVITRAAIRTDRLGALLDFAIAQEIGFTS